MAEIKGTHLEFIGELDRIMEEISDSKHKIHLLKTKTCCTRCLNLFKAVTEELRDTNHRLFEISNRRHDSD